MLRDLLVRSSAGKFEPNRSLIVPKVPLVGDGFSSSPVSIQALQLKVNNHAVFAGESLVGVASNILDKITPASLLSNKEQRLAAIFQDTVHPFVWFMSNPEVSIPTGVDYIDSSLLPKEWPVYLFSIFNGFILNDIHRQAILEFFRSDATYGSEGWLSAHRTCRIMQKKFETADTQWKRLGNLVGNTKGRNARLVKLRSDILHKLLAAQNNLSSFRSDGIHLLISTPKVYRQCSVNGLSLNTSLNRNIVCVPYGKSLEEATSISSNEESARGEQYEEWVGQVKFFLAVDVQRSEGSVSMYNDKKCKCPESCSSVSHLGFNSCRKWNLAYIEW